MESEERAKLLEDRVYTDEMVATRCPYTDRVIGVIFFRQIADTNDIELGKVEKSQIDGRYVYVDFIHLGDVEEEIHRSQAVEIMLDLALEKCPGSDRIAYRWSEHYREVPGFPDLQEDDGRIRVLEMKNV